MVSKILYLCRKIIVFLALLAIGSVALYGQVNANTPSATELIRRERIPVSYFNGLPSIEIPIYTINSKDLVFPISLSYHASGIKVNQYPTMVGLGWNMNLGAITRVVNGLPDETCRADIGDMKGGSHKGYADAGYYYSSYTLDRDDWASEARLIDYYVGSATVPYDIAPDEFVINAYGLSGSIFFYRDSDGTVHSRVKSNNGETFKVECPVMSDTLNNVIFSGNESEIPLISYRIYKLFKEFTVIKNDGTKLIFGGGNDYIEFHTEKKVSQKGKTYLKTSPSSWLLKEIVSPNGNKMSFKYRRDGSPIIMSDIRTDVWTVDYPSGSSNSSPVTDPDRGKSFIIQHPLYPLSIISDDGLEIHFSTSKDSDLTTVTEDDARYLRIDGIDPELDDICYSTDDSINAGKRAVEPHNYSHKLVKIDVYHKRALITAFTFRYIDTSTERLKLDMLNIGNAAGSSEQAYYFEYDDSNLPQYNSTVTDNWGYWNNKNYRNNVYKEEFFDFRTADVNYAKAEALTKLTYPTGGHVTFDYELNDYSKIATQAPEFSLVERSGTAGGLRIKQMTHRADSTEYVHSFEYKNTDGSSSGILSGIPKYSADGANHLNFEYSTWWGLSYYSLNADIKQYYQMESEACINALGMTTGNHVTYSRVVESIGKTNPLRKEYLYTNHDTHPDTADFAMYTNIDNVSLDNKFTSRALMRGLLTNEVWYNGDDKVKEIINRYDDRAVRYEDYVKSVDVFSIPGSPMAALEFPFARYAPYKILTFYPYLTSRTEHIYDPTGTTVISSQEEQYTYNENLLLKKMVRKDSKGRRETTSVTYPDEYGSGIYTDMTARNMISCPVETTKSVSGRITSASLNEYKEYHSNILPAKTWRLNLVESLDSTDFTQYYVTGKDPGYVLDSEVVNYDNSGNPLHIYDNQGIHTSYKWGYGASFPTAQIINAANTYKQTTEYTPRVKMGRIDLDPDYISSATRNYTFTTYQTGDVTISLGGALGYDWLVTGTMDSNGFTLVQLRSDLPQEEPWNRYATAYTYSVTFTSVPAGYHTLSVKNTSVRVGNLATGESGGLTYTYQGADAYVVEEGEDEFLYENFEDSYLSGIYPFGYHSSACYVGKYTIDLKGDSDREYILDYRVYDNGKWNYVRTNMEGRSCVIDEGINPIDEVRVYPADADMQSFSWNPHVGMLSRSTAAGVTESYGYDRFGRLETIKDNNGNIIRYYNYNYASTSLSSVLPEYYNEEISMAFYSSVCDKAYGNIPVPVEYVVPAQKYRSAVSQSDANRMAFNDLISNGQAYADSCGTCEPHVVVYVYNTSGNPVSIQCAWRENGITQELLFPIPPSEQTGASGILIEDFSPKLIYLPRKNYIYVEILNQDMGELPFISEFGHNCGFMYSEDDYLGYRDTYIIR